MQLRQIQEILDRIGMIHISGSAGSGKTLLTSFIASQVSKDGHVDWLCADGKTSFVTHLKRNIAPVQGRQANITFVITQGHENVKKAVLSSVDRITDATKLIIIDPITRVLDMGRESNVMWGRTLFEEILPTLGGLMVTKEIPVVIVSEVRSGESGIILPSMKDKSDGESEKAKLDTAVYHDTIRKWADIDLLLVRKLDGSITSIYQLLEDADPLLIGEMRLSKTGEVILEPVEQDCDMEVRECLESQSSS